MITIDPIRRPSKRNVTIEDINELNEKIKDITTGGIPDKSITTDKVVDGAVTEAKLSQAIKDTINNKADMSALDNFATKEAVQDINKLLQSKQGTLTVEVLTNDNIRIGNLEGGTKDFMPATPSGDPMHYAYEAWSAEYNSGDDYIYDTPWADMVDSVEDKERWGQDIITSYTDYKTLTKDGKQYRIVKTQMNDGLDYKVVQEVNGKLVWDETKGVHISKHWLLNGVGDMTNGELQEIYPLAGGNIASPSFIMSADFRTIFPFSPTYNTTTGSNTLYYLLRIISIPKHGDGFMQISSTSSLTGSKMYYILSNIKAAAVNILSLTTNLTATKLQLNSKNIKIDSTRLSKKSLLYMINNAGTAAVTITLNSTLNARFKDDKDVIAALASHTNVTLAEG